MTYAFIVALMAVAALVYVALPGRGETLRPDPAGDIEEQKMTALTAILDLEADRDVGKLSEVDLAELRLIYEKQAIDALHRLDHVGHEDTSDALEREIAIVRERMISTSCPNCGAKRPQGGATCARCGA